MNQSYTITFTLQDVLQCLLLAAAAAALIALTVVFINLAKTMKQAGELMDSANKTMEKANALLDDVQGMADDAKDAVEGTKAAMRKVTGVLLAIADTFNLKKLRRNAAKGLMGLLTGVGSLFKK